MCIAIANKKGQPLSDQQLNNCWSNNPDGAGIMYKEDGILKVYKQLNSLDRFKKKYNEVIKHSNCLVHFRVVSRGEKNLSNIHPFFVNKNLGFIHNGTIHKMPNDPQLSDTQLFNQGLLKNLPKGFTANDATMVLIEEFVGHSKLVFMDENEQFTIINEDLGERDQRGNWYSNNSWKQESNYMWKGNTKVYKTSNSAKGVGSKSSGSSCSTQKSNKTSTPYIPKPSTPVQGGLKKIEMVPEIEPLPDSIKYPEDDYLDDWYDDDFIDMSLDDSLDDACSIDARWNTYIEGLCYILDQVPDEIMDSFDTNAIMKVDVMYTRKNVAIMGTVESALTNLNEENNFNIMGAAAIHIYEKEAY